MMKRKKIRPGTLLMLVLNICVAGMLAGCTNYAKDYDANTLIIGKNGSVVEVAVEDYTDSTVTADDLTTYIDEQIQAYNDDNGKKVIRKKTLQTDDLSNVKLVLSYKNMDAFNGFNSLSFEFLEMEDVAEEDLTGTFQSAEDESDVDVSDILETEKAKAVIIPEKTNVVVKGDILYYNNQVKIKDGVVSTKGKKNAIIIFQ